jgi:hypothetical protein
LAFMSVFPQFAIDLVIKDARRPCGVAGNCARFYFFDFAPEDSST